MAGANLTAAATTAFAGIGAGAAGLFTWNGGRYLGINNGTAAFSAAADLVTNVTGLTPAPVLSVGNYFV